MSQMMRAAVVHTFGRPLSLDEVPVRQPGPGQVLIQVMASGVCHTDLHAAAGESPSARAWALCRAAWCCGWVSYDRLSLVPQGPMLLVPAEHGALLVGPPSADHRARTPGIRSRL